MLQFEYLDNSYAVIGQVAPLETDIIIPLVYDDGVNGEHPVTEVGGFISSGINSVVFSNNVKVIRGQAFAYNNLTEVSIPDSVESIQMLAFERNNIETVHLGNGIKTIGSGAFEKNNLEFVSIPQSLVLQDGIEPIMAAVFSNNSLKNVQWNSNASILSYMFNGADNKIEEFIITYDGMVRAPFDDSFSWDAMTKPMKVLVKNQGLIDDYRNTMHVDYQWKNWESEGKIIFDIIDENLDFRKLGSVYVNPNSTRIREIKFLPEQEIEALKTNAVESKIDTLYVSNETELSFEIIDNLLSESTTDVLSANQGRVLKDLIDGKQTGKVYSDIEDMVNDLNIATDYKQALNLFIVDLDVPDFWISSVEETSVPYTYTTDEALINAVKISPVQIGLYKISALETAKVDLTRIQNAGNTQFVDTASNNVAIDLNPSLSQGGGSETGRLKFARNFFELYVERIHTNPNFKYRYQIEPQTDGSIKVFIEDTFPEGKGQETYSFDFNSSENPNQVARMKELQDAVDTIADMLGVL